MSSFPGKFLELIECHLDRIKQEYYGHNDRLSEACCYALSGKGKRVRSVLALLCAEALGGRVEDAIVPAVAVEMIHTYSLVHDDLPLFDDDDLRRGRPTVHVKFDEPTAVLAGDGLLTDAWRVLSEYTGGIANLSASQRLAMVREFAMAGGGQGMALGQMLDMQWTRRNDYTENVLEEIHTKKTGALIAASCVAGGLAATPDPSVLLLLRNFGESLGLAFQVADDLLDDMDDTGKSKGKDLEAGKLTYIRVLGRKKAREFNSLLTEKSIQSVEALPGDPARLKEFALSLLNRIR